MPFGEFLDRMADVAQPRAGLTCAMPCHMAS